MHGERRIIWYNTYRRLKDCIAIYEPQPPATCPIVKLHAAHSSSIESTECQLANKRTR
jgi:hypothetical protein